MRIFPCTIGCNPTSALNNMLLPPPLGPTTPVSTPVGMANETLSRASRFSNSTQASKTWMQQLHFSLEHGHVDGIRSP